MDASKPKFTFESSGIDETTFTVVRFKGTEGLSTIYRFNIMLISEATNIDIDTLLQNPATLTIKRDNGDIPFKGMLRSFEQLHQTGSMCFYRAELVPRLWWGTLSHCNEIFLDKKPEDFLGDVLKKAGLKQGLNFDFKLQSSYSPWEYVCQYDESHFHFLSRWMEHQGMYYYFEQTGKGEKMLITDTHIAHTPMEEGSSLTYSPPSNLDHAHREEVVKNFMLRQQPLPKKVLLKDYNYRNPSLEMKAEAEVSSHGMGEIYLYGEHFRTIEEGEKLAHIRAEELLCREKVFHGESTVPYIRPGYIFALKEHYRQDFNQQYLTTEAVHEGSQEAYLVSGLGLHLEEADADRLYYRNSFTCIPKTTQFRAERTTVWPKFSGSINAKIDASGSGQYAELDKHGRYKVVMPFDKSGRSNGKATTWLRMAQPYGGSDHGMHFPLHKGTEVLITCIDGDPDRPVIQAAVPNPENPSLVKDANQTTNQITTAGQNRIHLEDKKGSEGIHLHSPISNSGISLGAASSEEKGLSEKDVDRIVEKKLEEDKKKPGIKVFTEGKIDITGGYKNEIFLGNTFEMALGSAEGVVAGNVAEATLGASTGVWVGMKSHIFLALVNDLAKNKELLVLGDSLKAETARKELVAAHDTLRGEVTDLTGEHNRLANSCTTMQATVNELTVHASKMGASTKLLVGEMSKLAGQVENLGVQVTEIAGSVSDVCGELASISGSQTGVSGDVITACGDKTSAIAGLSEVSAESSRISAEMNEIAGLINQL